MPLEPLDYRLLSLLQQGLPLVSRPYANLAAQLGISESEALQRVAELKRGGLIRRLGIIVNHRQLGYRANAMVVWDIPDDKIASVGAQVGGFAFVNLCYRRPRQGQNWPYNLFCMIHGKSRETVLQQLQQLTDACDLSGYARQVLFSRHCFKQRGALYPSSPQNNGRD